MRIHIGTSGWSYPAWKGRFYPADLPSSRMLAAYSTRLGAVEVNATAYRMPREAMLAGWRITVPAGFTFALKAPQRVTHRQRLLGSAETMARFYQVAAELGPALGAVLFKLPPTLRKDLPRLRDFLALLPPSGRAVFELPHESWHAADVLQALAEAGAALCITDTDERTTPLVATAGFGYLRLRRADYDDEMLLAWAERIRTQPWSEALAFFKHEDEARGPAFALRMQALAGEAGLEAAGPTAGVTG